MRSSSTAPIWIAGASSSSIGVSSEIVPSVSDSSLAIAWNHVLARVATLQRARGAPIDSIPEAVEVGRALEASTLGVVIIRSYEEALGKRLLKGSAMSAGPVGAEIRWALVDCRTGAVLWMDARATQNLTYESLKFRVPEMVSSLP